MARKTFERVSVLKEDISSTACEPTMLIYKLLRCSLKRIVMQCLRIFRFLKQKLSHFEIQSGRRHYRLGPRASISLLRILCMQFWPTRVVAGGYGRRTYTYVSFVK